MPCLQLICAAPSGSLIFFVFYVLAWLLLIHGCFPRGTSA